MPNYYTPGCYPEGVTDEMIEAYWGDGPDEDEQDDESELEPYYDPEEDCYIDPVTREPRDY